MFDPANSLLDSASVAPVSPPRLPILARASACCPALTVESAGYSACDGRVSAPSFLNLARFLLGWEERAEGSERVARGGHGDDASEHLSSAGESGPESWSDDARAELCPVDTPRRRGR